jgi:hypothetical protein
VRDATSAFWHQTCTAKTGRDEMSVVDSPLQVYGVKNLRIADGSIMPRRDHREYDGPLVIRFDLIKGGNVNGDYLSYSQYYESDIPQLFRIRVQFRTGRRVLLVFVGAEFSEPPLHGGRTIEPRNKQSIEQQWPLGL